MLLSIWDDGYGISVANEHQICKADLSEMLSGFARKPDGSEGFELYRVHGWDYPALVETYLTAARRVRRDHVPAIVHVAELTQPQGHSTSGSHERYKSPDRLAFEVEFDGLRRMRGWMLAEGIAGEAELDAIEKECAQAAREAQRRAWDAYQAAIRTEKERFTALADRVARRANDRAGHRVAGSESRSPAPASPPQSPDLGARDPDRHPRRPVSRARRARALERVAPARERRALRLPSLRRPARVRRSRSSRWRRPTATIHRW